MIFDVKSQKMLGFLLIKTGINEVRTKWDLTWLEKAAEFAILSD